MRFRRDESVGRLSGIFRCVCVPESWGLRHARERGRMSDFVRGVLCDAG